jgi:hypothetical protein
MALKGLLVLDIDIDALFVQLHNMSSFRTSIELFTNSLDGEKKTNFPMPEELVSGSLAKKFAQIRKVYNIKNKLQQKLRRRKIRIKLSGSRWNLK